MKMKRGMIVRLHPGMVPRPGAVYLFRNEHTGETWEGVRHSDDEILIIGRYGYDCTPAGDPTDPRFDG